jgi:hypothetical protein
MSEQQLNQPEAQLIERIRDELADQVMYHTRSLERRLMERINNNGTQSESTKRALLWWQMMWGALAMVLAIITSGGLSFYMMQERDLATSHLMQETTGAVQQIGERISVIEARIASMEATQQKQAVLAIEQDRVPVGDLPATSLSSKNSVRKAIGRINALASELERMANTLQPHVRVELNKVAETLRQSIPVMCERTGIPKDECRAPTAK